MAQNFNINGVSFPFPDVGDQNWGQNVTNWAAAVSSGLLQKAGGLFTLTAEVDFGTTYGTKQAYLKSRATNPASTGIVRLGSAEAIAWRNNANSADLPLTTDASDNLLFNGHILSSSGGVVPVAGGGTGLSSYTVGDMLYASGTTTLSKLGIGTTNLVLLSTGSAPSWGQIVNASVATGAAIAYSKLALTASVVNADIAVGAAIAYSKLALTGAILNADLAGSIAASKLVGSDIATVGTITSGTWSATTIALNKGGTGQTTATAAFDALAPTTTKGDLVVRGASNNVRLAIGTDGQVPVADSTQTSGVKWATLQQGAKNYITYNNFENNATTGWSLAHSALTSLVPTSVASAGTAFDSTHGGTAASGNLAISVVSSNQLAGSYSLSYASSAATTAGDMLISQAYTIDAEDQAKAMTGKFYFKAQTNPSNANWSGTSSNSFAIWIYDVTNAAWIQPAGTWGMTQSSGIGYCTFTWQTPSNMTQFQVAIVNLNATSGAATVYFDDFVCGPQTAPLGVPMTDWVSYTPTTTAMGTVSNMFAFWRRVGDSIQVKASWKQGTASGSSAPTFSLPAGMSIDTAKVSSANTTLGLGNIGGASSAAIYGTSTGLAVTVDTSAPTVVQIVYHQQGTAGGTVWELTSNGANTNTWAEIFFEAPISGWSSNIQMSSDTDTRVVSCRYELTAGSTIPNAGTVVAFGTKIFDTHGATVSAGVFTAPVAGYYRLTCNIVTVAYASGAVNRALWATVRKNSSAYAIIAKAVSQTTTSAAHALSGSVVVPLNAGDTLDVITTNDDTTTTSSSTQNETYLSIERLSGPAVVAATELVAAKYNSCATSFTGGAATVAVWTVKEFDTHNAYSAGTFTCPVSGIYEVSAFLLASATSGVSAGDNIRLGLKKNGSSFSTMGNLITQVSTPSLPHCSFGSTMAQCNAGDTLQVELSNGDSTFATDNNTRDTWVSFKRLKN
jgi:hypothetical protein